jgi:hypothetical protein
VILCADQLQDGDRVAGYGTVTSVLAHHRPGCDLDCFDACTRTPRVVVTFDGQAGDFVFDAYHDLDVQRPEPPEHDQESELTSEDRW